MNKFLNFFTTILFISTAILISCGGSDGGGDDVDPVDTQGNLVAAGSTATPPTVKLDNVTITNGDWDAFSLTFTYNSDTNSGSYTTTGSASTDLVWPASGTWTFGGTNNDNTAQIVRSDGVTMDLTVSASNMTLAFNIPEPGGRLSTFGGDWVFSFTF